MTKGYKGFNQDLTCRGFQYEIGKTYKCEGEIEICSRGFHFCKKLQDVHNFYDLKKTRVCEIEADGRIIEDGEKSVCSCIKIIRELSREEVLTKANTGEGNTGLFNSGDSNSGYRNSGDSNSGYRNSGYRNSGDSNSGDSNSGDSNSGYRNSGYRNSGYRNSGNRNSGSYNSGDYNSGLFCACDYSSGIFMTKKITYEAFNKQLTKREYQKLINSRGFLILLRFGLYSFKTRTKKDGRKHTKHLSYKSSWRMFWQTLSPKQKMAVKRMPHFDAAVFYEITGIKLG